MAPVDCACACPIDGQPNPVLSLPVAYYLELTASCNNRCPGCGNVYSLERAFVSLPLDGDAWCRLVRRLAPHTHLLNLTGGEATLHPSFAEIVRTIDSCGIPFTVFTNGRWPHEDRILTLLRTASTCDGLLVSLHGPDAATHEAFSGVPRSFKQTVATIRRATEAGLNVATSIVINRHNWDRIEETMELALSLGANHIVCNRLIGPEMVVLHR